MQTKLIVEACTHPANEATFVSPCKARKTALSLTLFRFLGCVAAAAPRAQAGERLRWRL